MMADEGPSRRTRAALYVRVSSRDQDPAVLLRELREYAARRGWAIAGGYFDTWISWVQAGRPAQDQLMADARRRGFDVVVVTRFDCFARSTRYLLFALEEFRRLGIGFVSLTEGIDTSSSLGEGMLTLIGALAQFERQLFSERVRASLGKGRDEGKRLGRPRAIVDRLKIAALQVEGLSYREISRRLGIPESTVYKYREPSINDAQKAITPIPGQELALTGKTAGDV